MKWIYKIIIIELKFYKHIVKITISYYLNCQSDGRPVWSRTSDCQSGNPGSNPGRRINKSKQIRTGKIKQCKFTYYYI